MPNSESSPFASESEAETSLRKIQGAVRDLAEAEKSYEQAVLDHAFSKDELKKHKSNLALERAALIETAEGETVDLPLFPSLKALPEADKPPAWDPNTAILLIVPGVPSVVVQKLADRGIETVGQLAAYTNGGGKLTDVKGISEALAGKTADALAEFWGQQGAA
jgi:predicted flap endonuclease-1-like 5' DNA nuclease